MSICLPKYIFLCDFAMLPLLLLPLMLLLLLSAAFRSIVP